MSVARVGAMTSPLQPLLEHGLLTLHRLKLVLAHKRQTSHKISFCFINKP